MEDILGRTCYPTVTTFHSFISAIKIYGKSSDGTNLDVVQVLATSLHELTHAAYFCQITPLDFLQTKDIIIESWAVFGEWLLLNDLYPNHSEAINFIYKRRNWVTQKDKAYSPLFIDMIDDDSYPAEGMDDEIEGYDIKSLNKAILNFNYIEDVEKYMKKTNQMAL